VLPKRRRDFDPTPADDEYERVSVGEIQLVDAPPAAIIPPDPPSLSPMAVELEETVLALTRKREHPPAPPVSTRPSVAWFATIFAVSTMLSLGATSILRAGEGPVRTVAAASLDAPPPPPVVTALPVIFAGETTAPPAPAEADAGPEGAGE
jgi:hypothetical protein